jgi:dCMP deaminase
MQTVDLNKQPKLDINWLAMAFVVAKRSKDPSTKVGAVIVAADGKKVSVGYNGFPAGTSDIEDLWNNRPLKYQRVIHAEANAIINCPFDTEGSTIYCTLHPCYRCMGMLINAGIKRIVYYGERWEREEHPEVTDEFSHYFEIRQYVNIDFIEEINNLK